MTDLRFYPFVLLFLLFSCTDSSRPEPGEKQSGAATSLDQWAAMRTYPDGRLHTAKWYEAHRERTRLALTRSGGDLGSTWESIGPKNFGGRTLCLAFHPTDPQTIFAGSASGGLWKTTTGGVGTEAWEYVPTGFPVLGVAAVAINPEDPNEMYIGTGEVYNYNAAKPGIIDRFTRGTYGIGILKTTDGGVTWEKSLDWSLQELTGVQDIIINPDRPATVYAATTEGVFRTYNAGNSWEVILDVELAVDLEMQPGDTTVLFASVGNLNGPDTGIYRSTNGGNSFAEIGVGNGLPALYTGKTVLAFSKSNPDLLYASVANVTNSIGLYRSNDLGNTWMQMSGENVAAYQGWYSHDVVVDPNDPDRIVWVGINAYVSENAGNTLQQVSWWFLWDFGQTPVGGPEGPPDYVHADIHAVYYHPLLPDVVLAATDGGIFYSEDGGVNWEGRNGGLQTQQFYADFGVSQQDSVFMIGGLQDNASAMYVGDDAWVRVLGGDGMTGAVHPYNDSIVLGSYYNLNISRSLNRGANFEGINVSSAAGEQTPFNAPFGFAPAVPDRIYAGATRLHRSDDNGTTWAQTSAAPVDGGNMILTIGQTPADEDLILVSTVPGPNPPAVLGSNNGGLSWFPFPGLPDRICTDVIIDPTDQSRLYAVFSGFGTPHLYRSIDEGQSWQPLENGIPDVPGNAVLVDELNPQIIYFANDLGVYVSFDDGDSFEPFCAGLPDAVLAMHLAYSPTNRKLILATHGSGVYQASMLDFPTSSQVIPAPVNNWRVYPNPLPAGEALHLAIERNGNDPLDIVVMDETGRRIWQHLQWQVPGESGVLPLAQLPAGWYVLRLSDRNGWTDARAFTVF